MGAPAWQEATEPDASADMQPMRIPFRIGVAVLVPARKGVGMTVDGGTQKGVFVRIAERFLDSPRALLVAVGVYLALMVAARLFWPSAFQGIFGR